MIGLSLINLLSAESRRLSAKAGPKRELLEVNPVTLGCQECLLNKIEIGQFMQIKYKLGTVKKTVINIAKAIEIGRSFVCASIKAPDKATASTAPAIGQNKLVGYVFNFCPWLLKNSLLAIWTPLKLQISEGVIIRVDQKLKKASGATSMLANNPVNDIPKVMLPKNIRFQKLSLFKRALIQFIILLLKPLISFIIPCLKVWSKRVFQFLVIIISCCSYSFHAQADTEEIISLIKAAEVKYQIPEGLLHSIAKVESGFAPYALNIEGKPFILKSLEEVKTKITSLVQAGVTSFDIGVMQLNYRWHGDQFADPEQMLLPKKNIEYAARLLKGLYKQHKDWRMAVKYYHSATPMHHKIYSRKVIMAWIGG